MKTVFTKDEMEQILGSIDQRKDAQIFRGNTQKPFSIQSITLSLDTAVLSTAPRQLSFPFKSVYVSTATDTFVSISLRPITDDTFQSAVSLKLNDSLNFDNVVSSASLYWSAQAGKTVTLIFFTDAEFRSGSQISVTGGGVSIVEGSAVTNVAVTLAAATATSLIAADSTRKIFTFSNDTGAVLYVGSSSVSATSGLPVAPGAIFQWRNTGALYGYSVLGGTINGISEA